MPTSINDLAIYAVKDEQAREKLILAQEQTILKLASAGSHHFVSKDDDEWSVALCAFSKAIDTYAVERGDFLPYAGLLIRRDLTDWYRANAREPAAVISLDDTGDDFDGDNMVIRIPDPRNDMNHDTLKDEIIAADEMLMQYGFRFFDLTECSPKQDKTREQCAAAIRSAISSAAIFAELELSHKLPIRKLSKQSGVSRKVLDRYRKYIIMAILILKGDFPQIAEYLKFVKKEGLYERGNYRHSG